MSFTKVRWKWKEREIYDQEGDLVLQVKPLYCDNDEAERIMDLIAAAPEMLTALNKIVKLARLDCSNFNCACIQCNVVRAAKAAIAKAEGK